MKYLFLLLSFSAYAELDFVKLNRVFIEAERGFSTNRHWNIPQGEEKQGELNLVMETTYFNFIYSRNKVDSMYTDRQFRYVALTKELAVKPFNDIEIYAQHTSQHALDFEYSNINKYPNENSFGIRLILFEEK